MGRCTFLNNVQDLFIFFRRKVCDKSIEIDEQIFVKWPVTSEFDTPKTSQFMIESLKCHLFRQWWFFFTFSNLYICFHSIIHSSYCMWNLLFVVSLFSLSIYILWKTPNYHVRLSFFPKLFFAISCRPSVALDDLPIHLSVSTYY